MASYYIFQKPGFKARQSAKLKGVHERGSILVSCHLNSDPKVSLLHSQKDHTLLGIYLEILFNLDLETEIWEISAEAFKNWVKKTFDVNNRFSVDARLEWLAANGFIIFEIQGQEAVKRHHLKKEVKEAVLSVGACVNCGSTENLTVDHIIPFSKGGTHYIENLQCLCKPCNGQKFNKLAQDSSNTQTNPKQGANNPQTNLEQNNNNHKVYALEPVKTQAPTGLIYNKQTNQQTEQTPPLPPKGEGASNAFEKFWSKYPHKTAKKAAQDVWRRKKLDPQVDNILLGLERHLTSAQWKRGYIPHPPTWLRQERWLDETIPQWEPDVQPKSSEPQYTRLDSLLQAPAIRNRFDGFTIPRSELSTEPERPGALLYQGRALELSEFEPMEVPSSHE